MHVAVVGAGALGAVYGVRLAVRARVGVTFVVRPSRVGEKAPIAIETVRGAKREAIEEPVRRDAAPPEADAILLAVRTEDLDALAAPLSTSEAPIVVLTPMLPKDWARMRAAWGDRVHAAMAGVVAYERRPEMQAATGTSTGKDAVVRYWTLAATKIDEPRGKNPSAGAVRELAASLSRAGLRTKLELGVHETNPATTVCLIPIGMAIAVAGDVSSLLADEQLLELTSRACREGVRLAHRIGAPEPWARLAPVFSAPWALRVWLGGLAKTSPEALFYAEEHFGRKLTAQHRIMIREMADLTRDRGLPHAAIDELARRLEALD